MLSSEGILSIKQEQDAIKKEKIKNPGASDSHL
jgi:hypothetical protein